MSLLGGHRPQPHRGTLTPLIPLSLRAFKGEGEIRIEAHVRALHARGSLIQYWGGMGMDSGSRGQGGGVGEEINGVGRVSTRGWLTYYYRRVHGKSMGIGLVSDCVWVTGTGSDCMFSAGLFSRSFFYRLSTMASVVVGKG